MSLVGNWNATKIIKFTILISIYILRINDMGIQNRDGALYFATGVDNTGLYSGRREAIGIIKAMAGEITSFDVFGGIGISAGIAFAQAAKGAYDFEKQFQQSMKEVATLSSGIKGSLTDYMNQVIEVTREVPILANDAAKALYQIVSAGHDGADGMKILEVSAKAAIGGVTDTATAADGITTLLNAYKLDVSQAEKISNQLFTTVKLGKTSFGELGQSIAQAAPVAAAYGVEIDQVLAAVATLTKQGTPTAQAMTQIRAAIVGVSKYLGDGAYNGRTFQEALEMVRQKAGGSEAKLREMIPEMEAVNGLLGLTGQNAQEAAGHLEEMQNATGAAEAAFQEMASSAQNQLQLLQNNVTAFLRPMGESILKEVSGIASSFNEAFANGNVERSMKTLGDIIVAVTSAMIGYKGSIIAVSAVKKLYASLLEMERYEMLLYRKAVEAGTISENVLTASQVKGIATRKAIITTIKLHTAALKRNIAALTTNPYVLAAAAVAALGYTIYKVVTYQSDMEKMQSKLNNAMKEAERSSLSEQRELVRLKGELDGLTKGTDEYNTVKDKIVKGFSKYYSGLADEIEKVGLTEAAYNKLTEAINKSFGARQYEKFASEQQEALSNTMADNLEKIQKRLIGRLGDEAGSKIFAKIRDSIIKGTLSFGKYSLLDIQGLDSETKAALDQISGAADKKWKQNHELEGYIRNIILANQMTDELDKKARERFGVDDNTYKTGNSKSGSDKDKEVEKENENISSLTKKIREAEASVASLRKQSQAGLIDTKKVDDAVTGLETLKKQYKTMTGNDYGSTSLLNSVSEQQEKIKQLMNANSLESQRQSEDLENKLAQSKIDVMAKGFKKEQAQRDLNNKIEIQNFKRQKEDYIRAEIQAQKEIFDAKEDLKAKQSKGYVKKIFDASTVNVDEIIAAWDKIVAHTETKQGLDEWQEREDAMNKYLMEYGTFSQKKAAIDKKFQDDINKETTLGAKNALQKQWNEAVSSLKVDKLKQEINWEMVFGDLSNASKESLDKIKKQLKEFRESQEYQSMDIDQKKIIDESLNKIQTTLIDKGGLLGGLPEQLDALRIAQEELIKAQEEYNDALKNGTESEQEAALIKKNNAEKGVQNAQTNVSQSAEKATSNVATLANVITDLGSNSQMSLSQVGQLAGTLADTFSESGKKIGGIIGAVFSALDSIGEQGIDGFLGNIFDSIFNAAYGAWDTVFGWTGLDFGGESDPQLQKDIENLTQSNQDLEMAIDNLADKMESTSVVESTEVYNQQKSNLEQQMRNTQEMMRRSAEAYSNGFLGMGGSHSSNKKINNAMSSSDWARISGVVGHTVNNASDFWNLTSEQMAKVALEATDLYTKIKNSADDGYRDAAQYMDSYISYYKELEELQNAYYEKLTSTSFDSVKDNFRTSLLEMKDSTEAFAEDFEEVMQNALLEIMMTGVYDKKLQEWYANFAKSVESDKKLTPEEMEASKQDYLDIVEEAKAEWENYQKMFGWSDSTSDSANDSLDSFISQMENSLNSLDVTAKDISNNIYDYFRQAMINALYEKEYKDKMEELYKTFEDLSADGLSESDMAQLGSQVDQYIEQMMKGVEDVNNLFADKLKDNEDLQSFVDNVKSAISSIEATAEDVTDNIFEYIRQQMVEKMFADTFQPQIEEFYKKVQDAMSDGDIADAEKDALRSEAEKLANDIVAAKDILADTLGITSNNLKKELEEEFKSFSDGVLNSLYDAEVTVTAVSKNIADSMRKELIEAMYIEQYEPRIKAIWEKWKEYSADGLVTDEERANIKNDIDELSKEAADAAKEISDAWKDTGEEVAKAFDSFSDSIKSVLYNAEATAEDVANNIYEYMRKALVDSMFVEQVQPQIKAWYDKYTEFMADGAIDSVERGVLDEMLKEIQDAGIEIVDAANKLFPSLDTGAQKRAEEAAQEAENAKNAAEQEWESFSDDILNSLYDIEATAEDISDNMGEYMRKALIKAMYVNNFKPQMQKWYDEWQKAMGDDDLSSEEKQTLDAMKQSMIDDMKKEVDAINQFFGTMYSQEASSKRFETISQDTGDEISGRLTGVYESSERIRLESAITNDWLATIYSVIESQGIRQNEPFFVSTNVATSVQEQTVIGMQGDMLKRLEDIYKFNAEFYDEYSDMMLSVIDHLDSIHKNTNSLPRIETMLKEIKQYSKALAGK
nr:MAG TPA: minor tail protein [Caudoviricetes sp.]